MRRDSTLSRYRWIRAVEMLAMLGILLLEISAWAQTKPDFLGLQKSVAKLKGSSKVNQTDPALVKEVASGVNEFEGHLKETKTFSKEEVDAVSHLRDLLSVAASNDVESVAMLKDIDTDLRIKNQFYRARLGVTGEARGLVKVTVTTLADSKAVSGFIVYCNPYRWAASAEHSKTFGKLSSPTEASMLPGLYRCVATKAGGDIVGERPSVEIGLDGKDSVDVDIPVKP